MIKLPVKDCETIPWMSKAEIPTIKAALSAWRRLRREDKARIHAIGAYVAACSTPENAVDAILFDIAYQLEKLAAIDKRIKTEAKKCAKH